MTRTKVTRGVLARRMTIALALLGATACGGSAPTNEPSDAAVRSDASGLVGDATRGRMFATTTGCATAVVCHGADLGGLTTPVPGTMVYPQNITPDMQTGIGGFSDEEIVSAVRTGVHDGHTLCPQMPRIPTLTDQQAADLVAYLRSVAPVSRQIPASHCTSG
jgi:mono/diheme cytochrome c family protein